MAAAMGNSSTSLDTNVDSDSEEYDCQMKNIPKEHSILFQNISSFTIKLYKMRSDELLRLSEINNILIDDDINITRKRLINHFKMEALIQAKMCDTKLSFFPYFVIIDIEATCHEVNPPDHIFEIIEFPAVLVDAINRKIVDKFQAIIKPTINKSLTEFCINLTGITQDQIDKADPFTVGFKKFTEWLEKHELGTKHKFAIVTDGSYDMTRFLYGQCIISNIPYPAFATKWINIRKTFRSFYFTKKNKYSVKCNLQGMLSLLNLHFEGNPHRGIDDTYNLAILCLRLLKDGVLMEPNERIINLKNRISFKKDDPLPLRPLHNMFCSGIHVDLQHSSFQMEKLNIN